MNVTIGGHRPPGPAMIPSLMDGMFGHINVHEGTMITRAAWAHVQFETIHPFADGNGRAGRALLQTLLGCPLPLSRFILRERETYYELFQRCDWPAWLAWFCRGILEECRMTGQPAGKSGDG